MGLSEPKRRMKLSHDPNNTKWTNDTQSFGQKIMRSQGWQPGDYLGAKDAPHAEFHTEANATHIRVAVKDDNLGIGAKIGSGVGPGECTGLDAFQNLLGRLNGRDEDEMEKEQKSREDLKRAIYTEQRWGSIRFVKGGMLIGDKIQPLIEAEAERVRKLAEGNGSSDTSSSSSSESEEEVPVEKVKKSKKRKIEEMGAPVLEVVAVKVKKSKKKRKSEASPADEEEVAAAMKEIKISKKKSKKDKDSKVESEDTLDEDGSKARKREKKERKREKRERKEKDISIAVELEDSKEARKKAKREKRKAAKGEDVETSESSRPTTKESTPLAAQSSGRSTPMMQGRHAVRARNIAQKRLASMDAASLNQIFMIKSQ